MATEKGVHSSGSQTSAMKKIEGQKKSETRVDFGYHGWVIPPSCIDPTLFLVRIYTTLCSRPRRHIGLILRVGSIIHLVITQIKQGLGLGLVTWGQSNIQRNKNNKHNYCLRGCKKTKQNLNGKKGLPHPAIQVDWLRFSSDSQRESRHRFDETIKYNGRLLYIYIYSPLGRFRLLYSSSRNFCRRKFLPLPVGRLLIDRASRQPSSNSAGLLTSSSLDVHKSWGY